MLQLNLTPTDRIVEVSGIPMRIWEGKTANGLQVHAHIAFVGCQRDADARELEHALREVKGPRPADEQVRAFPLRMIL